jgi:hypothetical protein
MFTKTKQKIKKYFAECFNKKTIERGVTGLEIVLVVGLLALAGTAYKRFTGAATNFPEALAATVSEALTGLGGQVLNLTTELLTYVLNPSFTTKPIVGFTAFDQAWASVRDLTNMLIVLGFVVVGIATTLRFQDYSAKKILPYLIGVAILVNFSGFFCQITIDTSNTVANALLQNGSAGGLFSSVGDSIRQSSQNLVDGTAIGQPGRLVANSFFAFLILVFSAYIFLILGVLLAARYSVLAALYILSPLAMFFFIFPITKSYWKMWIENFLKWSFLGVTTGFFITLGLNVLIAGSNAGQIQTEILIVSFIFIYIGYKMARTTSAMGASALIGATSAVAGYAMGRVGQAGGMGVAGLAGLGKGALEKTGLAAAGRGITRFGEKVGAVKRGTAAGWEKSKMDEASKTVENITDDRELARAAASKNFTPASRRVAAAATQKLAQKGKLNLIPEKRRDAAIQNAINYGSTGSSVAKDIAKADPRYAIHDKVAMASIREANPLLSEADVQKKAIEKAFGSIDTGSLKNLHSTVIDGTAPGSIPNAWEHISAKKITKAGDEFNSDQIAAFKTHLPEILRLKSAATAGSTRYKELDEKYDAISKLA